MKLIIDIPDNIYDAIKEAQTIISGQRSGKTYLQILVNSVEKGTPLDDVKAEIEQNAYPIVHGVNNHEKGMTLYGILQVLDNIGKAESEDKE